MQPTFGSLFAGVGGFDLGMEAAGYKCLWQVEWDKNCQQTLRHHWPDVPKWLDVCDVNGAELPPVDVITFGSPCQDLSVAGKRAGLDGTKSSMFFEAIRIIKEMQHATGNAFPRCAIWENVPGALSSNNGDDFATVITEMGDLGAVHVEWSVLDAQFFGIPQRRRRVFVIAVINPSGTFTSGQQIFAVGEGRARNPKTGKQSRKDATATSSDSFGTGGEQVTLDSIWAANERERERERDSTRGDRSGSIQSGSERQVCDHDCGTADDACTSSERPTCGRTRSYGLMGTELVGALMASDWKFPQQQQVHENKIVVQDVGLHETSPGAII